MTTQAYRGEILKNRTGGRYDWFFACAGRVRWGTLAEVKADVDHWKDTGAMPPRLKGSWA